MKYLLALTLFVAGLVAVAEKPTPPATVTPATVPVTPEPVPPQPIALAEGRLTLPVPGAWTSVKPRNKLIEFEFRVPGATPEAPAARLTVMASGGTIKQNIDRWMAQFRLGQDADGRDAMRRDERELEGVKVHVLDIAGTYFDTPQGPFGPKAELANHRMLAAILETKSAGNYFVKLVGPAETVATVVEAFDKMLAEVTTASPEPKK